jgi:hypothetical protein
LADIVDNQQGSKGEILVTRESNFFLQETYGQDYFGETL